MVRCWYYFLNACCCFVKGIFRHQDTPTEGCENTDFFVLASLIGVNLGEIFFKLSQILLFGNHFFFNLFCLAKHFSHVLVVL